MRVRVIDVDGSVTAQPALTEAAGQVIDASALGPSLRLWASRRQMRAFGRMLADAGPVPGRGIDVTFIGSGDYNHLSAALIEAAGRQFAPLTVVHFDNHPDWGYLPPAFHCGNWINRLLDMPEIARVITIGPCSDDLNAPQLKGGNIGALASGRLELYPWRHAPSRVWGRVGSGPGHRRDGGWLRWRNVAADWSAFLDELVQRLPPGPVWITIDKDVLGPADAVTNWDQGEMPVDMLLAAVRRIAAARRVAGADICGEYAPPLYPSVVKRLAARFEQPRWTAPADLSCNLRTNQALLATFEELAA